MVRGVILAALLAYLLGVVATAVVTFHQSYVEGADTGLQVSQAILVGLRWPITVLGAAL